MFFRSPFVYDGSQPCTRVLALYSDRFLGEVRLKPYLNALLGRGSIADYCTVDRAMNPLGALKSYRFTHIWCQRNVSTAQFRFLRRHGHVPIIYDLDDLLTSVPPLVMKTRQRTVTRIDWCLRNARAVTVASDVLATHLRQDVPGLPGELIVLKNGWTGGTIPDSAAARKQIVWTSGDLPFFLREFPDFAQDLAKVANRSGFEVVLIGRFNEQIADLFERSRRIPYLDFQSYREFLRFCSGAIAIAPLPTRLPSDAQRFFDAKSDIKLVDYLSSGLLPIVSRAAPYENSELFLPALAAGDDADLIGKVQTCIDDYGRMSDHIRDTIYAPGLLSRRAFSSLSEVLDPVFKTPN